jgi:hypothetical protein
MDEEGGRPGAGTRHATQPPAGAAAGGRASTVATHAITLHGTTVVGSSRGLGEGQDNGESSDVSQELGTIITRQSRKRTDRGLASKIDDTLVSHTIDPISRPNS